MIFISAAGEVHANYILLWRVLRITSFMRLLRLFHKSIALLPPASSHGYNNFVKAADGITVHIESVTVQMHDASDEVIDEWLQRYANLSKGEVVFVDYGDEHRKFGKHSVVKLKDVRVQNMLPEFAGATEDLHAFTSAASLTCGESEEPPMQVIHAHKKIAISEVCLLFEFDFA